MAATQAVEILLRLQGGSAFSRQARKAAGDMRHIGDSSMTAGQRMRHGARGLAQLAGGAAAAYGAFRLLKGSISTTEELAKSTGKLSRMTGMDAEASSAWVQSTKYRGIESKQLFVAFQRLATGMRGARDGSESTRDMFRELGVTQKELKAGDTTPLLMKTADAMKKMKDPTDRTALAVKLFGRKGNDLVPILMGGSKAIQENHAELKRLGATMGGKSVEDVKKMAAAQRTGKAAMDGIKLSIGAALMPALIGLAPVMKDVAVALNPLLRNKTAILIMLGLLAGALLAVAAAAVAAAVAELAALWPFVLGAAVIAAIVVALFYLYHRFEAVRTVIDAVGKFIAAYWPYILGVLTGGLGLAVIFIVRHFGQIKAAATSAVQWVGNAIGNVVRFVTGLPGKISRAASGAFNGLRDAFKSALNWIIDAWNNFRITIDLPGVLGGGSIEIGTPNIPQLAAGGNITRAGTVLVGERGPEMLSLPAGAQVAPLPTPTSVNTRSLLANTPIVTRVYLDRRQIAQALGNVTADQLARA